MTTNSGELRHGLKLALKAIRENKPATFGEIVRRLRRMSRDLPVRDARRTLRRHLHAAVATTDPMAAAYHIESAGRRICSPSDPIFALDRGGRRFRRLPGRDDASWKPSESLERRRQPRR